MQEIWDMHAECLGDFAGNPAAFATARAFALLMMKFEGGRFQWTPVERKTPGWLAQQVANMHNIVSQPAGLLSRDYKN
jgi:hypothetical protein